MNRNASRPPLDNERSAPPNGYYPPQEIVTPPQARPRQYPTAQSQPFRSRPDQQQPGPQQREQYREQQAPVLQRQRSRPEQPFQRAPTTPAQRQPDPYYQPPRQPEPSSFREQPPRSLQRQPSRPDQYYPEQTPPSRQVPQNQPMSDSPYTYKEVPVHPIAELPMQPVAPAFVQAPSRSQTSPPLPTSESQATLLTQSSRSNVDTMLIRGNADDELHKNDAFWRRFDASAQVPDAEKSSWLERTQGKSSRYSRVLWIAGAFLVVLAASGIAIGVYLSFRNNSDSRPSTLGGGAEITSPGSGPAPTTALAVPVGVNGGNTNPTPTSSILHVSPTNTVD